MRHMYITSQLKLDLIGCCISFHNGDEKNAQIPQQFTLLATTDHWGKKRLRPLLHTTALLPCCRKLLDQELDISHQTSMKSTNRSKVPLGRAH